jgi:uncharacterized protein
MSEGWAGLWRKASGIVTAIDRRLLSPLLLGGIWLYRVSLSWLFRGACRFVPSCSAYAYEAVSRHGAVRGLWMSLARLARCHPFGRGGFDPVP